MSIIPIFVALILDILAFTIILPLMPRLLDHYRRQYELGQDPFFGVCMHYVNQFKLAIRVHSGSRLDIVLFGGAMGSLFSLLQFLSSPFIGRLSDRYGRKRVLLWTMIGNILSALLWTFADQFYVFVLARVVGGLSEGNVQLSIAMISDLTTPETRSKGLALVGIAFALGFTFGPALGAYFAAKDLSKILPQLASLGLNSFSAAAALCLVLLVVETIYIWLFVNETGAEGSGKSMANSKETDASFLDEAGTFAQSPDLQMESVDAATMRLRSGSKKESSAATPTSSRLRKVNTNQGTAASPSGSLFSKSTLMAGRSTAKLAYSHFLYLFFFSGAEFTLTFLTFDRFRFTNMQQGYLLGFVGILSSLIQGGYVRRMAHKVGEKRIILQGILACFLSLASLSVVGTSYDPFHSPTANGMTPLMGVAALMFAFASATVINGMNSLTSLYTGIEYEASKKGQVLGEFRSVGQLGRALGPLVGCSIYWLAGGLCSYMVNAVGVLAAFMLIRSVQPPHKQVKQQ